MITDLALKGAFLSQNELINHLILDHGIYLNRNWIKSFLFRHQNKICRAIAHPQEDARLSIPRLFLQKQIGLSTI